MLIRGHKINKYKYKYKLEYLHISEGIKKNYDINNIYSMTNMSMNCRDAMQEERLPLDYLPAKITGEMYEKAW